MFPASLPIVISLGGSLMAPPTGIDAGFLRDFRQMILAEVNRGQRFIFIVGGGATCRAYQRAAAAVTSIADEDMDWLGIHATRLNGHLLRTIFRDIAHPVMIKDPSRRIAWTEPILVAAGWKPGWSTDYVAVRLARLAGAKTVVNLTNIAQVYDKDPAKHADAKPFDRLSWHDFRKIVGSKWSPGSNAPFDPVASRLAAQSNIRVVIAKGTDLKNVKCILDGKKFFGTIVE